MSEDKDLEQLRASWVEQDTQIGEITKKDIEKKVAKFARTIRFRNIRESVVCLVLIVIFFRNALQASTLWSQIMFLELSLACLFITFVIYKYGRSLKPVSPFASTNEFIVLHRKQLEGQIRLLSVTSYWYIAPLMFGIIGLTAEQILFDWQAGRSILFATSYLIGCLIMAFGIGYLNEVTVVRKLKEELRQLPN
jgi:hypothetical protein